MSEDDRMHTWRVTVECLGDRCPDPPRHDNTLIARAPLTAGQLARQAATSAHLAVLAVLFGYERVPNAPVDESIP